MKQRRYRVRVHEANGCTRTFHRVSIRTLERERKLVEHEHPHHRGIEIEEVTIETLADTMRRTDAPRRQSWFTVFTQWGWFGSEVC